MEAMLLLLLLLGRLLLLLLPTLEPPASPVPPFPSWTRTSTTGRLRTSGIQGVRIYHSLHTQRLSNHLLLHLPVGIRVTDYLIDLQTGDVRAGNNRLTLYRVQRQEVVVYVAVLFLYALSAAEYSQLIRCLVYPSYSRNCRGFSSSAIRMVSNSRFNLCVAAIVLGMQ